MSGFEDLKDLLLTGQTTRSGEEEELHRPRKTGLDDDDGIRTPELINMTTTVSPTDIQQDPAEPEPPHIKEEEEEVWSSQEGEQLQGLEEADTSRFSFTPVCVKSEDDEEEPQCSQLHQRPRDQMEPGADGEDCGGPEPDRNSDPETHLGPQTERSAGSETTGQGSGLNLEGNRAETDRKSVKKTHSCSHCGKKFKTKWLLAQHVRIHTGEKPFSCSTCGKSFNVKSSLFTHLKTHPAYKEQIRLKNREKEEKDLPSCSKCGRRFERKHNLIRHMRTHTGERPFSCSRCGKSYTQKATLKAHMTLHTGSDATHGQGVHEGVDSESLTEHTRDPVEERPFICSDCGKTYTRKCHLNLHMRVHSEEKPFSCSECGKQFYRKFCLTLHMAHHRGEKPYSCSVCAQSFCWQTQLRRHVCVDSQGSGLQRNQEGRETGTETSRRDCGGPDPAKGSDPEKGVQTENSSSLKTEDSEDRMETRGRRSASNSVKKRKGSPADVQQLSRVKVEPPEQQEWSSSLDQQDPAEPEPPHIKEEEEEVWSSQEGEQLQGLEEADASKFSFTPVCVKSEDDEEEPQSSQMEPGADREDCGDMKTANEKQENIPKKKPKSVKKLHRCSVCGKIFKTNQHLIRHFRIHTGEKPFSCPVCGKNFNLRENLSKHKIIHIGAKQFPCSQCGKSFIRKGDLIRHTRIHSGEKPFSCFDCGTSFNFKQNLTRHMRIHSRGKPVSNRLHHRRQTEPEPEKNIGPETHEGPEIQVELEDSSGAETDDSYDWRETREHPLDSPNEKPLFLANHEKE